MLGERAMLGRATAGEQGKEKYTVCRKSFAAHLSVTWTSETVASNTARRGAAAAEVGAHGRSHGPA